MLNKKSHKKSSLRDSFFPKNHKAQISSTMTWIIATILIIVTLMIFIYASAFLAEIKIVDYKDSEKEVDWLEIKTSFAYSIKDDNKKIIDEWIEGENEK